MPSDDLYAEQVALDGAIRVTAACWTRWFLVTRKPDIGLLSIEIFDNPGKAAKAKVRADRKPLRKHQGVRDAVCLFAGPTLPHVVAAHPEWFDATLEVADRLRAATEGSEG